MRKENSLKSNIKLAASRNVYLRRYNGKETEMFLKGVDFVLNYINSENIKIEDRIKLLREKYIDVVCRKTGATKEDVYGKRRTGKAVLGKMIYAWFLMDENIGFDVIGAEVNRNRTSINYYERIRSELDYNPQLKNTYEEIKKYVNG